MAMAQVRDVAALAGVSPATVSNALNHPHRVSARTLAKVQAVIEELGYVRNDAARQLRAGSNPAVGMIVLDAANPYFTDVAHGAEQHLAELGRPLLLGNSAQREEQELTYLRLFDEQRVAGVLIAPVGDVLPKLRTLKDHGTSVVIIDRKAGADEFSSVSVNDEQGGWLVADHLIGQGARRIAVIGGPGSLRQVRHRLHGTQQRADRTDGVTVEFLDTGAMDIASGRETVQRLLERPRDEWPEAIFATNDLVALGALQVLARAGVEVPGEIMLAGYDDIEFAASATIPITSVRQPSEEMGRQAAELLRQAIEDPAAAVQHTVFQPELMVRESTSAR
ncbi:LacI family DNA-binding transcriptional regulator [Nesterenkonia massiliensis]|uniref:LacI family DNA-binding transcriptional regulator n=1 Tax=Nesterenkonia massiliensis TaxID=1232429 RepID=UPI000426123F|nr:LacI family DNA-binding transcriptional regulator [Nesterenkonia massiliensis]